MPWLTIVTFLPLVGVPVLLAGRGMRDDVARSIALFVAVATFVASLGIYGRFEAADAGFQMVERAVWIRSLGISYALGVDGVSLWMVLLTTFLFPLAILASWKVERNVRLYMISMLVLECGVLGTFLALDLLLFFVFFEAILVPMYLIIGGWGGERRVYAAVKFFLYTMAGSAFLLVGDPVPVREVRTAAGRRHLLPAGLVRLALPAATARWLFLAFLVAFAVKVPMFPLHTWLPDAHTEAPTAGSVILAGVMLKVGRVRPDPVQPRAVPGGVRHFAGFISMLALIGIVYGALVALIQTDIKRLVAYSSVSHLGFVVLGIFAFTNQGMTGAVLQMVNHGLSTGALFLLVGMVYERTHTRDLGSMGGLASVMPWLAGAFLFAVFASAGCPASTASSASSSSSSGSFSANMTFGAVASIGVVLARRSTSCGRTSAWRTAPCTRSTGACPDVSLREVAMLAPVLALLLVFGVYPKVLTDRDRARRRRRWCATWVPTTRVESRT